MMKVYRIEKQSQEWERTGYIVRTTKDPNILRKVLEKGNDDTVSGFAAANPHCPPEVLKMVLENGSYYWVSQRAAGNPNCPPEALRMVLERGDLDAVSQYAAGNPNCPPDAKLKWMRDTGQITKEDPNIHDIEYSSGVFEPVVDNDLEELRKLRDSKRVYNLKKQSQARSWYTEDVAENTNDRNILRHILEEGNDDKVSMHAAWNPNCPPDALKMVLERGKDNKVSWGAAENLNCPPDALKMVLERGENDDVSYRAANNPNCPPDAFKMVLARGEDDKVSMHAVWNPNCSPDALKMVLERGNDNDVSRAAARNPNCPPEVKLQWMRETGQITKEDPNIHDIEYAPGKFEPIVDNDLEELRKLRDSKGIYNLKKQSQEWVNKNEVDWYTEDVAAATKDPNILRRILKMDLDNWVSRYAASNRNCPSDALKIVLERGNDDGVSGYAVRNPNCPPDARFKWMRDMGRITKEDPNIHDIEYSSGVFELVEPVVDNDLEELRKLRDSKRVYNLKKQSQEWYKEEVARDTNDPNILRRILEKGNDDYVSGYAVRNPNCPPETLRMVLERGNDDYVSYRAAENPNCPPDALRMVLERGNDNDVSRNAAENPNCPPDTLKMVLERGRDDWVSMYAVKNPNCPTDALKMVLERGNDDYVSGYAAENPNCPPDAKLKWMMATGQITKEDPNIHDIEYSSGVFEPIVDNDLEELRKLRDIPQ